MSHGPNVAYRDTGYGMEPDATACTRAGAGQ